MYWWCFDVRHPQLDPSKALTPRSYFGFLTQQWVDDKVSYGIHHYSINNKGRGKISPWEKYRIGWIIFITA